MITTHVLDIARGTPAAGIDVILEMRGTHDWVPVARGTTDANGRLASLTEGRAIDPGTYQLVFDLGDYHRSQGVVEPFFPEANVTFTVRDGSEHYHIPLVVSPFGYSTYRGT
ncbi:MAG TPA: hydroxyisourate hydrolase [Vicinamibacterales bacterium]|jgi:5-hydroxyisourate hydrolase